MLRDLHRTIGVVDDVAQGWHPPVALINRSGLRILLDGVNAVTAQCTQGRVKSANTSEEIDETEGILVSATWSSA